MKAKYREGLNWLLDFSLKGRASYKESDLAHYVYCFLLLEGNC